MTRQTRVVIGVSGGFVTFGATDAETDSPILSMEFTPEQARRYARVLVAQADIAEGKLPEVQKLTSAVEADPLRNERPELGSIPSRSTAPPPTASAAEVPLPTAAGEGAVR